MRINVIWTPFVINEFYHRISRNYILIYEKFSPQGKNIMKTGIEIADVNENNYHPVGYAYVFVRRIQKMRLQPFGRKTTSSLTLLDFRLSPEASRQKEQTSCWGYTGKRETDREIEGGGK